MASDQLLHTNSVDSARRREDLAKREEAVIGAVAIFRRPSIDGDRLVEDHRFRRHSGPKRGQIDKQLEGGAGLADGLGGAVKRALAVILADGHGDGPPERKSGGEGKGGSGRLDLGGRRPLKKKKQKR